MELPTTFSAAPRMQADETFLAAKRERLFEEHIAPVNRLVDRIRAATGGDVPYVDPDSGGCMARVLFVLQAPGRKAAHDSGMISVDNNDPTADRMWRAHRDSGMPRTLGLPWNAVPWYVGTTEKLAGLGPHDVEAGRRWLVELLDIAPGVRVVISFGRDAEKSVLAIAPQLEDRGITHLHSIHPSPRNYNSRREQTIREVGDAFTQALRLADASGREDH